MLAVPQIAALARLARRLGITVSRAAIAADGEEDLDLWVRAEPEGRGGRARRSPAGSAAPPRPPAPSPPREREADFLRAAADWTWETDDALRLTALSPGAAAAIGSAARRLRRQAAHPPVPLPRRARTAACRSLDRAGRASRLRRAGRRAARRPAGPLPPSGVPADRRQRAVSPAFAAPRSRSVERSARRRRSRRRRRATAPPSASGSTRRCARRSPRSSTMPSGCAPAAKGRCAAIMPAMPTTSPSAGRHLLALVDDLVDLQAIERPDFRPEAEPIDLADLARRAAGLLAVRAADRKVRIDAPGPDESAARHRRFHPHPADPDEPDHQCDPLLARGRPGLAARRAGRRSRRAHRRRPGQGHRRGGPGADLRASSSGSIRPSPAAPASASTSPAASPARWAATSPWTARRGRARGSPSPCRRGAQASDDGSLRGPLIAAATLGQLPTWRS